MRRDEVSFNIHALRRDKGDLNVNVRYDEGYPMAAYVFRKPERGAAAYFPFVQIDLSDKVMEAVEMYQLVCPTPKGFQCADRSTYDEDETTQVVKLVIQTETGFFLQSMNNQWLISLGDQIINYSLPGGKVKRNESYSQALMREIEEELLYHMRPGPKKSEVLHEIHGRIEFSSSILNFLHDQILDSVVGRNYCKNAVSTEKEVINHEVNS